MSVSDKQRPDRAGPRPGRTRRGPAGQRRHPHGPGRRRASHVTEVADYTGQPEILGGRVKTLHPRIHGGILARRDLPEDMQALAAQGIEPIDLVVVNLYPFEATVARPDATFEDAVENIDIGGPSLIRAAAKNHDHVAVLTDPDQYAAFLAEFSPPAGRRSQTRKRLARAAFASTARYDRAIAGVLRQASRQSRTRRQAAFPPSLEPQLPSAADAPVRREPASGRRASTSIRTPRARTWRRPRSSTARSSPTTTCSTSTAPCG